MGEKRSDRILEKRIRELEEHLAAKDKEVKQLKNAFLSHINHEIRTPMNSIIGFSNLLADEALAPEDRDLYLEYINNSSEHLLTLLENLIDISMLESGQVELREEVCCLYEMFEELYVSFSKQKHRKSKQSVALLMNREISNREFRIVLDRQKLEQVMENLVENALKFTDRGTVQFGYLLTDDSTIQFYVKDTGRGLDFTQQNKLFDGFRKPEYEIPGVHNGIGVGLAIAKGLVKLMGGEIWVEPNPGAGSVFKFSLPVRNPASEIQGLYEEKRRRRKLDIFGRRIAL